jgi:hypothetical protein
MRRPIHVASAVALSLLVALSALAIGPEPVAAAPGDKRPNLEMLSLRDWHIQTVNGRRLLRFTSIFVNSGPGHFEVAANRSSRSDPTMSVRQRMFRWDGTSRYIGTPAVAKYAADGHDHFHVQGVVVYETWKETAATATRRGAKTGFCFLDSEPWNLSVRGARRSPYYTGAGCGTRASLSLRAGLSVGWADNYPWHFAYQWIDITGLTGGTYRVRVTVDIQNYYDETVETDNCVETRIRIPDPGSNRAPTVLSNRANCGTEAITPVSSFASGVTWNPPRDARFDAGRHTGCRFNSQGTALRCLKLTFRSGHTYDVTARANVPGQSGRWLYVTSGPFAGYWVRIGDRVGLVS